MEQSIQGIKSCHLEQASRTARIWQLGPPVLGSNFWFPGWIFFILVFWHSYKAYLNVFTWICLWTFFALYILQTHSEQTITFEFIFDLQICIAGPHST